ncbi:MAG: hypothetical protein KM312_12530 [Hydrogenibacillus schlegelii]|uniref:Uncharacterized protein n=1 Tax=Hydrogenibacillus schlegelii TaxID=1484 RepID=A0A947D0U5_HYDSH|nr:hypothetical protein [Hydrogenibacillus schlegelii]
MANGKLAYHPLYFLAALGFGGTAVSFFMYLMFLLPHPKTPLPTFEDVVAVLKAGGVSAMLTGAALGLIVVFAVLHYVLLAWNLGMFGRFRRSDAYVAFRDSSKSVALMAVPLTLAMAVNVAFILGALFVPGLWNVIEFLLPGATVAFGAVGLYTLSIFYRYFSRFILAGDLEFVKSASLSHMISIFAFSMIAVGLAAPAGMSHHPVTSIVSLVLAIFFTTLAASLAIVKLTVGLQAIFSRGVEVEAAPTLWIMIPILTMFGVAFVRLYSGVSHNFFQLQPSPYVTFLVLTVFLSLQGLFGAVGYRVMKALRYFERFVLGPEKHVGSFTLICPGIAFFVQGMFWLGWGLLKTGIVAIGSPVFYVLIVPLLASSFGRSAPCCFSSGSTFSRLRRWRSRRRPPILAVLRLRHQAAIRPAFAGPSWAGLFLLRIDAV